MGRTLSLLPLPDEPNHDGNVPKLSPSRTTQVQETEKVKEVSPHDEKGKATNSH